MITPNKFVTFEQSILAKLHFVLKEGPEDVEVVTLYNAIQQHFDSVDQFLMTLDVLYALGRIDIDLTTRTLTYVD